MSRARFVAEARAELLFEIRYYESERPGMGRRLAEAIEHAVVRALAFPKTGPRFLNDTRRVFIKDFPFAVVYRADAEGIVIFAVAHHRRRPNYWQSRVQEP